MTNNLLQCRDLRRRFGALAAVNGVDLAVTAGARHALIGPNGAGKSTLLRLIAGGIAISGGQIQLDGRDITTMSEVHRAQLGIGQTFQHSSLFHTQTAAANVALAVQRRRGRPWLPFPHRLRWSERVEELLALAGLEKSADRPVNTLSYEECRQLEVAVALATEPHVLLLDEPAAGMSAAGTGRLLDLLRGLPSEMTIVFVEHDLDLVFELATHVSVLHLGRVLMSGPPSEVRANEQVQRAYLGTSRRTDLFTTGGNDGPARG